MNATGVTAGPAESNGKLLLGIWRDSLHVTCGMTACTPGSAPGPTLGNEYGKTLPFLEGERLSRPKHCSKGAQPVPKAVHIAAVVYALATKPLLVFGDKLDEKAQRRRMIYYFASAAVAVDSSDMTASSSASWSRFSPPSNFANGHVSTMWFMICRVAGHSHKKVIGRDPICAS